MRHWLVVLICALSLTARAQVPVPATQLFVPSPLGIVLMIGKWIWDSNTQQEVYYIQVQGRGTTAEQARDNAFRLAVEQAVGTLILSETQTRNQRMVRDDTITYASGFVSKFKILNQTIDTGGVRMIVDVWVGKSNIAHRLMNESVSGRDIDGARLNTQIQTLRTESNNKVRAVQAILGDFPARAFDLDTGNVKMDVIDRKTARFETPVNIAWNRAYLNSLVEVLSRGAVIQCGWPQARQCARSHATYTFSTRSGFSGTDIGLDDPEPIRAIVTYMLARKPALRLSILDAHGRELAHACRRFIFSSSEQQNTALPKYLFDVSNLNIVIDPGYSLSGHISITAGQIEQAARAEVRVVPETECSR
jgi:hypothetical protein